MAFDMGFNFRGSSGYVTDQSYAAAVLGEASPHTYTNGDGKSLNGGWSATTTNHDRVNTNDPRIAGANQGPASASITFTLDLSSGSAPGAGTYLVDLAAGDAGSAQIIEVIVKDDTTALITVSSRFVNQGHFIDATVTDVTASTTWTGTQASKTFATTTVNLFCNGSAGADPTTIAHFRLTLQGDEDVRFEHIAHGIGRGILIGRSMEIQRVSAASTYITFPMLTAAGVIISGRTVTGTWAAWADTAGLTDAGNPGFRTLSGAFSESGATGIYGGFLASTELPAASPYVALRFSATGAATQFLLVRTATFFAHTSVVGTGAIVAGSFAAGAIDASAIAADAIGASEIATGAIDADAIASDAIGDAELAADAVAAIADAVWDEVMLSAHTTDNTAGLAIARLYHATDYIGKVAGGSAYADALLGRQVAMGGVGGRTVSEALQALRNRVAISAGTLTVYAADDSTASWTASVATQAVTAIVTDINPA